MESTDCFPLQQYPHITVEQETCNGSMKEVMIHNKVEVYKYFFICRCSCNMVAFGWHEVIIMQIWTPFHEESDVDERARGRRQANSIQIYSNVQFIALFSDTIDIRENCCLYSASWKIAEEWICALSPVLWNFLTSSVHLSNCANISVILTSLFPFRRSLSFYKKFEKNLKEIPRIFTNQKRI